MDQIRTVIGVLWRERFWVLTIVGTIVAAACWFLAAGNLDEQFASRKQAIDGKFSSMQTIRNDREHPNDKVIGANRDQAKVQRNQVLSTWQELYDEQRSEVLKWPEESLDPNFILEVKELKFRDPFPAAKDRHMRREYSNYIGTRLDALLEIVHARKIEGTSGRGGAGGGREYGRGGAGGYEFGGEGQYSRSGLRGDDQELEDPDYIVDWLDQGNLREKLDFGNVKPTSLQIWVTQEDLWVYETLLQVIHNTNEARGATRPDNAAVRTIFRLEVGREAAQATREAPQVLMPSASTGLGGRGGEREMMMSERAGAGMSRREFMEGEPEEMDDSMVLANRYLNAEGEAYPEGPQDAEFRRLPIHMTLSMDQRWLPKLLVECANAALPVEVTQWSINPDKAEAGTGAYGRGGGGRGYEASPMTSVSSPSKNPNIARVTIDGIVYIYNEPDKEVLTIPGLEETTEESDQVVSTEANL